MEIYSDWNDTMLYVASAQFLDFHFAAEGTFDFRIECLLFLSITLWSPPDTCFIPSPLYRRRALKQP